MEALLGQELLEVVPGHAARDVREAIADGLAVLVAQGAQVPVDLSAAAPCRDDGVELGGAGGADPDAQAVVGQHLQLLDVLGGAARHHRVRPTRVVADHAAQRAVVVGGGIGPEHELRLRGRSLQRVEDRARQHTRAAGDRIDLQHPVQVFADVDHHGDVAALAGQAGAAPAGQDGNAVAAADLDGGDQVVVVARDHHAVWHLAVVGGVCGIQGAAAVVEADLAIHGTPELLGQPPEIRGQFRHVGARLELGDADDLWLCLVHMPGN